MSSCGFGFMRTRLPISRFVSLKSFLDSLMAQSQKQKKAAAKRRLENRAEQTVGHMLNRWNLLEEDIGYCIKKLCDLDTIDGAVILANLNFQSRMAILITMIELYTRDKSKEWRDFANKTFNRIFDINIKWRNVIAHNMFVADDDRNIVFTTVKAKRELKIPKISKSKEEFKEITEEMRQLGENLYLFASAAHRTKKKIQAEKLKQPSLSLAALGSHYLPQTPASDFQSSLLPNSKTSDQKPTGLMGLLAQYNPPNL